jgi:signal transducing adaptor molecule
MQPQTGHRPQSTYTNPQELATSTYSPVQHHQPPPSNEPYSASIYSQDDPYSAGGAAASQPQQQQYAAYVPPVQQQQQQQPSQPSYEPPAPPGAVPSPLQVNQGYPAVDARQTLPSQGMGVAQGGYKPYQRPGSADGREGRRQSGGGGAGGPADYYRQSTAY